jgi:hypothetical protein
MVDFDLTAGSGQYDGKLEFGVIGPLRDERRSGKPC